MVVKTKPVMAVAANASERAPGEGFLVLWVDGREARERDVQTELKVAGIRVENTEPSDLLARANERAPDLIILGGKTGEAPDEHALRLSASSPAGAIPVIALSPSESAAPKPRARYGLVARFDRETDPPVLAQLVSQLLEVLSTNAPTWRLAGRAAEAAALAARFASTGRAGLLTVEGGGAIAVDAMGGIAPSTAIGGTSADLFLHERAPGRICVLRSAPPQTDARVIDGARVLLIDDELESREQLASKMEQAGAQVRAIAPNAQTVHASRALDPTVVIVVSHALTSASLAPLWTEPRLAQSTLLVLDAAMLANANGPALISTVARLAQVELALRDRLVGGGALAERLETLGPARWLKILGRCQHDVSLRVFGAAGRLRVDLSGGRIQGATFRPRDADAEVVEGRDAVEVLMGLSFGRVLAGRPQELGALDGVSERRKPSAVGKIELAPSSGVRRKQDPVAQEVVVQRGDAARKIDLAEYAELGGDADEEVITGSYAPGMLSRLRDETGDAAKKPRAKKGKPRAEKAEARTPPFEPPLVHVAVPTSAIVAPRSAVTPPLAAAAPSQKAVVVFPRPNQGPRFEELPVPRPMPSPISTPIEFDDEERRSSHSGLFIPPPGAFAAPIVLDDTGETEQEAAPPAQKKKGSGNTPWFIAGIIVALAVGAWAAWRLQGADARPRPAVRVTTERTEEPELTNPEEPEDIAEPAPLPEPEPPAPAPQEALPQEMAPEQAAPEQATPEPEPPPPESVPLAPGAPGALSLYELMRDSREAARRHDYARSAELSRQAIAASPRNSRAAYRLAIALDHLDQLEEARVWAERASVWNGNDANPIAMIGDMLARRGRFRDAAAAYNRALQLDSGNGPAQRGLDRLRERGIE